jgi:hypothetical protein
MNQRIDLDKLKLFELPDLGGWPYSRAKLEESLGAPHGYLTIGRLK